MVQHGDRARGQLIVVIWEAFFNPKWARLQI